MDNMRFKCPSCGRVYDAGRVLSLCEYCYSPLIYFFEYSKIRESLSFLDVNSFWRYASLLPEVKQEFRISLGEGRTPLFKASRFASILGLNNLFLKDESRNPTNSFRDRAASLLVSHALSLNFREVVCASNGNLGAALAAYCARANIKGTIVVPRRVDIGKLAQMKMYGANIIYNGETVDEAIRFVIEKFVGENFYPATSGLNPLIIEAQKTIAYEIVEQIGVPDYVVVPVGDGGSIYSLWKGFKEFYELGLSFKLPKMIGVQSSTCSPIVQAFERNSRIKRFEDGSTIALAILVLEPLNGELALSAIKESAGLALSVSDKEITEAQRILALEEGVYAETASCAAIAAVKKLSESGFLSKDDNITCIITGSGLKDQYLIAALSGFSKNINLTDKVGLKLRILRLISLGETYGYSLWNSLSKSVSLQAVYQHLSELEERGLIISSERDNRKYYSITARGIRVLNALEELAFLL
ncbi:MAG: threonine synthase [Candidatus Odinarchaeum yellowstonii]|uniref:Threonine synthase n=1 Tax=Odinarchaeota yellowstonii (strain LCB_4) TaxID=1841599 RepID=A0AAF0D2Y6_ODILC|nr:MAG: threonine synthase [Candidatus Odinarchaeum yellowstonii]